MQMKLCSRCKKRVAVVYVTKTENGQTTSEGLCLRCAKELGIKPMSDIIEKLGISEEEFDAMADEVSGMIPFVPQDDDSEGRAPALDFNAILGGGTLPSQQQPGTGRTQNQGREKANKDKKFLSQFCLDLTGKAREGKLDSVPPPEKQPLSDRRTGRRQDSGRRGACAAYRRRKSAKEACRPRGLSRGYDGHRRGHSVQRSV